MAGSPRERTKAYAWSVETFSTVATSANQEPLGGSRLVGHQTTPFFSDLAIARVSAFNAAKGVEASTVRSAGQTSRRASQ